MSHPRAVGLIFLNMLDEEETKKAQLKHLESVIRLAKISLYDRYDISTEFMFNIDTSTPSDGRGFRLDATLDNVELTLFRPNYPRFKSELIVKRNIGLFKLTPDDLYSMIIEIYVSKLMDA